MPERHCPNCNADIDAVGFYDYRIQFYLPSSPHSGLQPGASEVTEAGQTYCTLCDAGLPWKSWDLLPTVRRARTAA
jgi:hypothetical protein